MNFTVDVGDSVTVAHEHEVQMSLQYKYNLNAFDQDIMILNSGISENT